MKVILNSDVIYNENYSNKLSRDIKDFIEECIKLETTIVLPRTTVLEADHQRTKSAIILENNLNNSLKVLKDNGIECNSFDAKEVVGYKSIVDLFKQYAVNLEINEPTVEIYNRAQEKASTHKPPCIKDNKSDEMRDIVIWETAYEIAQQQGVAILISRDKIHVGEQGDDEANKVNLRRFKNFNDALEELDVRTPGSREARNLLNMVWDSLVKSPIPIKSDSKVLRVFNIKFKNSNSIISRAEFDLKISNTDRSTVKCNLTLNFSKNDIEIIMYNILLNDVQWESGVYKSNQVRPEAIEENLTYVEKVNALRKLIGG
jgi:hypothetical protein